MLEWYTRQLNDKTTRETNCVGNSELGETIGHLGDRIPGQGYLG